ncbi:hypothetical protein F5X99DRAFT_407058 [Biscogniauxia marginata]|nr:hypothetical protein F5X99DRAFT_407058 [Biscogniauxia marginata]
MANPPYFFACGDPQEEVGALRLWEAILNTDILPQVRRGYPLKLPYLSCPRCRSETSKFTSEHLRRIRFLIKKLTHANLAEMSQLFWELLPLRSQPDHLGHSGQPSKFHQLMLLWTYTLTGLLTPYQYEGPFLPVVKRLYGIDVLRGVTEGGIYSLHGLIMHWAKYNASLEDIRALVPVTQAEVNKRVQDIVATIEALLRQANDILLTTAADLLIEQDGEQGGLLDLETLRVDYSQQLSLYDALSDAYGLQESAYEVLHQIRGFGTAITGPEEQDALLRRAQESMGPLWTACVRVRKKALDLVKFRED